jgi:glucose-6-phosphate 1-epimerase
VCFPWFGNKTDDHAAPAHGFVRTKAWTLESIGQAGDSVAVSVATSSDDETKKRWPCDFRLVLRAAFGAELRVDLTATNTGASPFTFEEALHTYFAVGDIAAVRITGLDGVRYADKVLDFREDVQTGAIAIAGETDRVYRDTRAAVDIVDPSLDRLIRVGKAHSDSTVVWNPWIEKARGLSDLRDDDWVRMVCVETCNVRASAVELLPGRSHTMTVTVSVQPLSARDGAGS